MIAATRSTPDLDSLAAHIEDCALEALQCEILLHPKPGLVSPVDAGSHLDMDITTFRHSLTSLRGYFHAIAAAGARAAAFPALQELGRAAERKMLLATGGVNTHRGAIFSLGLLASAAGYLAARKLSLAGPKLGETIAELWGGDIALAGIVPTNSHGSRAVRAYGGKGARLEASEGFTTLFNVIMPQLDEALLKTGNSEQSQVQTLFVAMSEIDDTNLLHRGGIDALIFVKTEARRFLASGGVLHPGWRARATDLHRACVARNLSPGGSADMLAAAWFVHLLLQE